MTNRRLGLAVLGIGFGIGLVGSGCGDGDGDPGPPPADLQVEGRYEIVSSYDLTVGSVLPEPVASYAQTLVSLRKDPAGTFFALLDQAGVPLASDLTAALPAPAAAQLKGWINDFVAASKLGNASVPAELDALVATIEAVVARPDVASRIGVPAPDARSQMTATHTLEELRYSLYGGTVKVTVPIVAPQGADGLLILDAAAEGRVTAGGGAEDARLVLGDHAFGVDYGTFALAALDQAMRQRYGGDLRGVLGLLVDCDAMAANVAGRCLLGVCVGHQDQVAALCDAGVDLVYQDLRSRVAALRFDALRLQHGEAQMWDAPAAGAPVDGRVDRLAAGAWSAKIDFGMGDRDVHGTFVGSRAP